MHTTYPSLSMCIEYNDECIIKTPLDSPLTCCCIELLWSRRNCDSVVADDDGCIHCDVCSMYGAGLKSAPTAEPGEQA
ncbi:hypothetical protein T11_9634 [Trichinella zimbabwensis]|uniref:Uncharacterized protein n=1 Tax=Trichinella zimbabwensis TaxID=268475 RepID=A0A0V1I1C7_9BILA|nr:hypothetical protein T11_9634 [Trichinella zimbabwensis]